MECPGDVQSVRSLERVERMCSRESDLLHWLYALTIDESLTAEQVRENARGALAEYLGEPLDQSEVFGDAAE